MRRKLSAGLIILMIATFTFIPSSKVIAYSSPQVVGVISTDNIDGTGYELDKK